MPYSKFTLPDVVEQFDLTLEYEVDLFPVVEPIMPGLMLTGLLEESLPLALGAGSEKARSEMIIAPILIEVRRQTGHQIGLFSGIDFTVDQERGLSGICDYLLSRSPDLYFVLAPVLAVIEAKQEDIRGGLGQCVASLIAAQIFNAKREREIPILYGAVTTGTNWRFLRVVGKTVQVHHQEEYLNPLERLLGILYTIVTVI